MRVSIQKQEFGGFEVAPVNPAFVRWVRRQTSNKPAIYLKDLHYIDFLIPEHKLVAALEGLRTVVTIADNYFCCIVQELGTPLESPNV